MPFSRSSLILPSVLFFCALFAAAAWPRSLYAQGPTDGLCSSEWFAIQRKEAASKRRTFQLISDGVFDQEGKWYALAVSHAMGADRDLDFIVFAAPQKSTEFRLSYSESIDILDITEALSSQESQCVIRTAAPYFKATVVDLSGDGTQQIVVESNSIGVCSSCLSEVRVYRVEKDGIVKALGESYNNLKYGKGQGLWVHSFTTADDGHVMPIEKSFFGAKSPHKKTP